LGAHNKEKKKLADHFKAIALLKDRGLCRTNVIGA
jgi:hypothetical protein